LLYYDIDYIRPGFTKGMLAHSAISHALLLLAGFGLWALGFGLCKKHLLIYPVDDTPVLILFFYKNYSAAIISILYNR
jgi:hypothetical protein